MRRTLLIAGLLSLLPLAVVRAEEFKFRDWYRKVIDFAASLISPAPQPKEARVPAAEIDRGRGETRHMGRATHDLSRP